MSRTLILIGAGFILAGLLWPVLSTLGLDRLPGDIVVEREGFSFYFPITTLIIASIILTLIARLLDR